MKRLLFAILALLSLAASAEAGRWVTMDVKWQNTSQGRPTLLSGLWPASLTSIYTRDSLWANLDSTLASNIAGGSTANAADTTMWFSLREADPFVLPLSTVADSMIIGFATVWMDSAAAPSPATATAITMRTLVASPGSNFRQDTTGTKQILHITRGTAQVLTFAAGSTTFTAPIYLVQRSVGGANGGVVAAAGMAGQMALEFSNLVPSAVGGGAEVTYNRLPRMRVQVTYYDANE